MPRLGVKALTTAGWQVTLCDPVWHVNLSSGEELSWC